MCRASWKNEPLLNHLDLKSELDAEAVRTYLDWLCTAAVDTSSSNITSKVSRYTEMFNLIILKLWAVANAVEDLAFKTIVVVTYFEEAHRSFSINSVKRAFVERKYDAEVRGFIIHVSLAYIEL
jgi:hypothetical protein